MSDASRPSDVPRWRAIRGAHDGLPSTLAAAFWALIASAVLSVIIGITQHGQTEWLRTSAQERVDDDPSLKMPTDADISSYVNQQLIGLLVIAAILGLISIQLLRGRSRARWYVFGVWVLATLGGLPFLPLGYLGVPLALALVTDDTPVSVTGPSVVAAICLLAAFVLTALPPSRAFFAQRKREDLEASGLLGEDGSRAPRGSLIGRMLRPPRRPMPMPNARAEPKAGTQARGGAEPKAGAKPSLSKSRASAQAATRPTTSSSTASTARRKTKPRG